MLRRFLCSAVTAPTAARTFHATPVALASGFTEFLKQVYQNPKQKAELAPLPVTKRGKLIGTWYRALSDEQKTKLAATAKANGAKRKTAKKEKK